MIENESVNKGEVECAECACECGLVCMCADCKCPNMDRKHPLDKETAALVAEFQHREKGVE